MALSSVVIRHADRAGVSAFPLKNDSPLVVYSNAAESFEKPFQVFEPVTRRNSKILCRLGDVQHVKLPDGGADEIRRKSPGPRCMAAVVEILRSGIPEREDRGCRKLGEDEAQRRWEASLESRIARNTHARSLTRVRPKADGA